MQLSKALVALALFAASASSAPVENNDVETSLANVICRPTTNNSPTNPFTLDSVNAQAQARAGGFSTGRSGYPHRFENREGVVFNVHNCDSGRHPVMEYPIFWRNARQATWRKDDLKSSQAKTPVRVAYANVNGGVVYCGIMVHATVAADYSGTGRFLRCN